MKPIEEQEKGDDFALIWGGFVEETGFSCWKENMNKNELVEIICQHLVVHGSDIEISDLGSNAVEGCNNDTNEKGIEIAVWKELFEYSSWL